MSRRTIKKLLRRADEALRDERFSEAEGIYSSMLTRFEETPPSLLDHAACLYGLVQTFHYSGRAEQAVQLAQRARDILSGHAAVEMAA